jgi:hypothetical protein
MSPLFSKLTKLARSPQGRRAINQAVNYARSPQGRKQVQAVRERMAAQRRRPRP